MILGVVGIEGFGKSAAFMTKMDEIAIKILEAHEQDIELVYSEYSDSSIPMLTQVWALQNGIKYDLVKGKRPDNIFEIRLRMNKVVENSDLVVAFWDKKDAHVKNVLKLCKKNETPVLVVNIGDLPENDDDIPF